MSQKNFVIIALGTNLGNRLENLKAGLKLLQKNLEVEKCSKIYESDALLPENAPKDWDISFYNCVFTCQTNLKPLELLELCKQVEKEIGGDREKERWAPRVLDVDIISYNNEVVEIENLKIPHERMLERSFVVWPLSDILPKWKYPAKGDNYQKPISHFIDKVDLTLVTNKTNLKIL